MHKFAQIHRLTLGTSDSGLHGSFINIWCAASQHCKNLIRLLRLVTLLECIRQR
jgi:hypothetical protein